MLISAAICTYRRYTSLRDSILSLRRQTLDPASFEILVIDNAPDAAESQRQAASYGDIANLRWIHAPPPGVARARNVASAEAAAPLLAFIDDDVQAPPDWLAAILAGFANYGEAVHCVGGPVLPDWSAPRPAWLADGLLPYLSLVDRGPDSRLLGPEEWLAGANIAYRRARVLAVGGFNTELGRIASDAVLRSNEETELTTRLHQAGGLIAWLPAASVRHRIDPGRLDGRWFRRRVAWQAVSDYLNQPDHFGRDFVPAWQEVTRYLDHMAPMPALPALAAAQARPDLAHWEMSAIYHLVLCLLGGLQQPPPDDPEFSPSDPSPQDAQPAAKPLTSVAHDG